MEEEKKREKEKFEELMRENYERERLKEAEKEKEKEVEKLRRNEIVRNTMEGLTVEMLFTQIESKGQNEVVNEVVSEVENEVGDEVENEVVNAGRFEGNGEVQNERITDFENTTLQKGGENNEKYQMSKNEVKNCNSYGERFVSIQLNKNGKEKESEEEKKSENINEKKGKEEKKTEVTHTGITASYDIKQMNSLITENKDTLENTDKKTRETNNFKLFSSQKKMSSSEIEIDAHVNSILNASFPRIAFGAELFKENR